MKTVSRDPAVEVEFAGAVVPARGRVLDGPDDAGEAESPRALVYAKYAPRYDGDLTTWRERALPVAIDIAADRAG